MTIIILKKRGIWSGVEGGTNERTHYMNYMKYQCTCTNSDTGICILFFLEIQSGGSTSEKSMIAQ